MRHTLPGLALTGLLALGLVGAASSAEAAALSAGAAPVNAVKTLNAGTPDDVVEIGRRWRHRGHRHRSHRPRTGFYLEFGTPGYRYRPPYYHDRPRYVRPRHVRPRGGHYRLPAAHVNWCYSRYRSYRAWDNTFQPYHGPRRPCRSPYWS